MPTWPSSTCRRCWKAAPTWSTTGRCCLPGCCGHWGQKGPAEIEPKRAWTFRQVPWLAHQLGIEMDTPAQHPFNPLALLRLGLASAPARLPNRRVVEVLMRHVWRGGADANDPGAAGGTARTPGAAARPGQRRGQGRTARPHRSGAAARGLFGVPTIELDGRAVLGPGRAADGALPRCAATPGSTAPPGPARARLGPALFAAEAARFRGFALPSQPLVMGCMATRR